MTLYVIRSTDGRKFGETEGMGEEPYHAAIEVARLTAQIYPDLTIQVSEDKVWFEIKGGKK